MMTQVNGLTLDLSFDPELESIQERLLCLQKENSALVAMQSKIKSDQSLTEKLIQETKKTIGETDSDNSDLRSVYVGNVDYSTQAHELEAIFNSAGEISRVTIQCSKFDRTPKGFAYIEFMDISAVDKALELDGHEVHGRAVKVLPKRTNVPGYSSTERRLTRGRGSQGRGFHGHRGRFPRRGHGFVPDSPFENGDHDSFNY